MEPLQVVWFKRDLRVADHQPLLQASRAGPVLPLAIIETDLWQCPDASTRQWAFLAESLLELRQDLALLGQPLVVRTARTAEQLLERARCQFGIAALWSHEETGNAWTFARDRRVAAWCRQHRIPWVEHPQSGVIRRLASRDGWARRWEQRMAEPLAPPPPHLPSLPAIEPGPLPRAGDLALADDPCPERQIGGRVQALAELDSFMDRRGECYRRELSSPQTAYSSCSRLSAHLAWGTVSMREVVQRSRRRRQELQSNPDSRSASWIRSLLAFEERLHWHCHFMQKLESQPDLEFRELHPMTIGQGESDPARLAAWARGRTGLPFVDACMRSLHARGWLNFRMRAMLMSVASHHLNLPWRESGLELARLFVDYEPGIHWSQCQMQSGTTGINTIRVYNPIKQGLDHDPDGAFIRRWVPELADMPLVHLHQPWTLDPASQERLGCVLGKDYPQPILDPAMAARQARERLHARRRQQGFAAAADAIQARHGSRRSGLRSGTARRRGRPSPPAAERQLQLELDGLA